MKMRDPSDALDEARRQQMLLGKTRCVEQVDIKLADVEPLQASINKLRAAYMKRSRISFVLEGRAFDGVRVVGYCAKQDGILTYHNFTVHREIEVAFCDKR